MRDAGAGRAAAVRSASCSRYQEYGGLLGRILLAILAVRIVSRRALLWVFQVPGLIVVPIVFFFAADGSLSWAKWGIFFAGLFTVSQFSFWGNYLPRVYPTYLRGTGESFAANVGGRMIGTFAAWSRRSSRRRCRAARRRGSWRTRPRWSRCWSTSAASSRASGCSEPKREELPE